MVLIRVLLVADKEADYLFIKNLLSDKSETFHIDWAHSFETGLFEIANQHYDIVLVDDDLGTHLGTNFIDTATQYGQHVPFILFTREDFWLSHEDVYTCSAVRCLAKHEMTAEVLRETIFQEVNWEKVRSVFHF